METTSAPPPPKTQHYAVAVLLQKNNGYNLTSLLQLWLGYAASEDEARGKATSAIMAKNPDFSVAGIVSSKTVATP